MPCPVVPLLLPSLPPLLTQGVATFTVSSPALLMASEPSAISDQVRSRSDALSQPAKRTCYLQQCAWGCSMQCGTQSNSQHMRVTVLPTLMPFPDVQVVEWMLVTLSDKSCSELWKLSCIQVACSHFYFTWEQALQVERGNSELALLLDLGSHVQVQEAGLPLWLCPKCVCLDATMGDT